MAWNWFVRAWPPATTVSTDVTMGHTGNRYSASQWYLMRIMASQITGNWDICSVACSSSLQRNNIYLNDPLWVELTSGFPSQRAGNAESISMSWPHHGTIYPMKYTYGFVVLCFVLVILSVCCGLILVVYPYCLGLLHRDWGNHIIRVWIWGMMINLVSIKDVFLHLLLWLSLFHNVSKHFVILMNINHD